MGQKSNITTLRFFKSNLNLLSYSSKNFVFILKFLKYFNFLLLNKGIWVFSHTLNYISNKLYLNISIFYRASKSNLYRKKGLQNSNVRLFKNNELNRLFFFFLNYLKII